MSFSERIRAARGEGYGARFVPSTDTSVPHESLHLEQERPEPGDAGSALVCELGSNAVAALAENQPESE